MGQSRACCRGDEFCGNVNHYVIGVAVEVETILAEKVDNERERIRQQTFGEALGQRST